MDGEVGAGDRGEHGRPGVPQPGLAADVAARLARGPGRLQHHLAADEQAGPCGDGAATLTASLMRVTDSITQSPHRQRPSFSRVQTIIGPPPASCSSSSRASADTPVLRSDASTARRKRARSAVRVWVMPPLVEATAARSFGPS